jgi:putative transposase
MSAANPVVQGWDRRDFFLMCKSCRMTHINSMALTLKAYRFRLYPDEEQATLFRKTAGCCRLVRNLALEQRATFGRRGRTITYQTWAGELKALKAELPYLKEVPHHCIQQALRDLDGAFAKFFAGAAGYPRRRRKLDPLSFRFPDPSQFDIGRDYVDLPKAGKVAMRVHRPFQGRPKSVTISQDGEWWYASILVAVRCKTPTPRPVSEAGIDVNVVTGVVEDDGTMHAMPRISIEEMRRKARLHKSLSRKKKGSRNRHKAIRKLRVFEARLTRRRRDAQHQISNRLTRKHTHIAHEALKLKNMTASAAGTIAEPGTNVAQKSGLNRSLLDLAAGEFFRQITYKSAWRGGTVAAVNAAYTSQICSACGEHPKDDPTTAHLADGRISRDDFVCPLCGFVCHADVNAAQNICARGIAVWSQTAPTPTTGGSPVAACGALGVGLATKQEDSFSLPSGLPQAA